MADFDNSQSNYQDQLEQERLAEELRRLYQELLKRDPTPQEYGLDRQGPTPEIALKILNQHQREIATGKQSKKGAEPADVLQYQAGLDDPAQREKFRQWVQKYGGQLDQELLTPEQLRDPRMSVLNDLNKTPVSFLRPDLTVRRDEVDTPEEITRFLQKHGGDSQINRQLLRAALDYGGLSIEPTPFGTQSKPGGGLEWYRPNSQPGDMESRLTGLGRPLTTQELSAIAQERQGAFRLKDPDAILKMATKSILAGIFAYAGGAVAGPWAAGLVGGPGGLGLGGAAGGLAGAAAGGAAGSAAGTATGGGDINDIWKSALTGGLTGGLTQGVGSLVGSNPGAGISALTGAGVAGAGNLASQGLKGDEVDWTKLLQAVVAGGAGGAASGLGGDFPGSKFLTGLGSSTGSALFGAAGHDPLGGVNAQLDQNALQREQDQMAAAQAAQDAWKAKYLEAQSAAMEEWQSRSAEAQAAQLEAFRAAQQEWESKKAEYEAKLKAFLAERQSQIEEALRSMGLAEPGIAGLLADRQKQIEARQAEEQQQQSDLIQSRQFFPSQLLETTGDTGASSLLVPHSPPPVLFGQEGLPASYLGYAQSQPPQFSSEGFLPSGALQDGAPPSVAPMGSGGHPPRYFPTLLGGLSRSPYLRYA